MSLIDVLKQEVELAYAVAERLFKMVDEDALGWKPQTGRNWMTVGQVIMHCTGSCGMGIKGFVTGDWGLPEGVKFEDLPPEQMLPPAEALPSVESIEQAVGLLAEDKQTALKYLSEVREEDRKSVV